MLTDEEKELIQTIGPKFTLDVIKNKEILYKYVNARAKEILLTIPELHPVDYHFINLIKVVCPSFCEEEIFKSLLVLQSTSEYSKKCKLC
jgi:hypothetical protein